MIVSCYAVGCRNWHGEWPEFVFFGFPSQSQAHRFKKSLGISPSLASLVT